MTPDHRARGGAALATLARLDAWEADLVINLRLWCEGPDGQAFVWNEYRRSLPADDAQTQMRAFERLIRTILDNAHRPLVRHDSHCACVGADECVFLHLVRVASDGHPRDAALIATLLVGATAAEDVAALADQVGACARRKFGQTHALGRSHPFKSNVIQLH